ncbi:MAG: endonuclease [Pseudopedobacter saltans]|uniref:Endonuclease n=1 Tax=Pseudopedobacter saltans TaxID=151895 RepID=A0A2W5E7K6_9SPHI|nr:MAG: endonuclease [Pseudopedobacter saltans]
MKKVNFFLALLCIVCLSQYANGQTMHIATYNLRNANHEDSLEGNGWGKRFPVMGKMVQFYDFDIWGTQEGKSWQLDDLLSVLPDYGYIGVGRDDGKKAGEYSAIFYKKSKFQLLKSGDFWLSETTDKPNKGWDAVLPRICTWGLFKEKKSGKIFYFYNLHMDHIGKVARSESAKLILSKIKEAGVKIPVILTGDFNVDQNSDSYKVLEDSKILKDAYGLAKVKLDNSASFNDYGRGLKEDERIDHIFLSKSFVVDRYAILTDGYVDKNEKGKYMMRYPSDHFPVMITADLK